MKMLSNFKQLYAAVNHRRANISNKTRGAKSALNIETWRRNSIDLFIFEYSDIQKVQRALIIFSQT